MCIKTMIVQNVTKDKIQEKQIYEMILKENLGKHKKYNNDTRKKTIVKFPINENLINLKRLDVKNKDKYSKYKN